MTNLQRIPATVITGFLGAGKTSMIRHLLETANGKRLALIINEFGDVGVDGNILKACGAENCSEEDIVELANGCICCTVADDFVPTMEALLDRPDGIDHIIIETSGLALPKPLLKAFNWPAIRTRITVDGVVTVVDGPAFADGLFAENPEAIEAQRQADDDLDHDSPLAELFEDQLACADLVVMNKSDLLAAEDVPQITQDLKDSLGKSVKVITTQHGAIDATTLLGLEAAVEDIEFSSGMFQIMGTDRHISLIDVAMAEGGVGEASEYSPDAPTFPQGCHICEVEIDLDTGIVSVERYVTVDDVGTVLNPMTLEGQIHGGVVQGIGQALLEQIHYDAASGQIVSGSFMDYAMPRADDICDFTSGSHPVPTKSNPLGVKGAGEAGTVGALPAVMCAVADALADIGGGDIDMPATPERVWQLLAKGCGR